MRRMSAALRQQLLPRLTAQWFQIVQLAIQPFRPALHPRFRQFLQPRTAVPWRVHLLPGTGDSPTP
jgi:hypothetical protein